MDRERRFVPDEGGGVSSAGQELPEDKKRLWGILESELRQSIDKRSPRIPDSQRTLETLKDSQGKSVAQIEKLRQLETNEHGSQDAWLIIDFDDVLNDTTRFQADLERKISYLTGLPIEKLVRLYDAAKLEKGGKNIFQFDQYVQAIAAEVPEKAKELDQLISEIDYSSYLNRAVERALLAGRAASSKAVRVSLLTFGDRAYQQRRIFAANAAEAFDDVIFNGRFEASGT